MPFLILLAIAIALTVVSYLLMPKAKAQRPKDLEEPTSEAGREIPVLFGTATIKSLNLLDYTDKSMRTYTVKA